MFSKTSTHLTAFWFLLYFTIPASATFDSSVKTNNHTIEATSIRSAYVNVNENDVRNNDYKVAVAVQVISVRNIEQKPISKLLWGCACGLAFLGVMKRRLSK